MFIIKIPAVPVNCTKDFDDKKNYTTLTLWFRIRLSFSTLNAQL